MIAGAIGIKEIIPLLKQSLNRSVSKEVEMEIKNVLNEIESTINNPYSDLK